MRKANKLLALALCVGLSVSVLGGCSSKKEAEKKEETKKEETVKEVNPAVEDAASYITLADYKTVEIEKSEVDKKLKEQIQSTLDTYTSYKKVKTGTVKDGDTINIYYVGRLNGEAFEGGSCTEESYPTGFDLTIGSNSFIDGFEDALIGKKVGKTYDIDVTFPESYPQNQDLAGKPVVFTVTINHKRGAKIEAKFNDEFVKKNLTSYKSVKDYKAQNRKSILRSMAMKKVCEDTKINKYPEDKVQDMKTQLKTSIENYLSQTGTTLEAYLEQQKMTEEDYNKQLEETAKSDVGNQLVYNAIAQAEKLEITDDEYQTELQTYLTNYGAKTEDALNTTFQKNYGTTVKNIIYNDLLFDKVSDYVYKNVKEV